MSKAFDNGKRTISGTDRAKEIRNLALYNSARSLSKDRCSYIGNNTINNDFTIEYNYTSDKLISKIKSTNSFDTLYALAQGHNICYCRPVQHNVKGDLDDVQRYGFQDLSGVSFFDESGNKLFDDIYYKECSDADGTDFTRYSNIVHGVDVNGIGTIPTNVYASEGGINIDKDGNIIISQANRNNITNKTTYMTGIVYPKQVPLHSIYIKPRIVIANIINELQYNTTIPEIIINTIIENCFDLGFNIKDIKLKLFRRFLINTEVIGIISNSIYTFLEVPDLRLNNNVVTEVGSYFNTNDIFTNRFSNLTNNRVAITKPELNYMYRFSHPDVIDICSNTFSVYGNFHISNAVGFNDVVETGAIFTVLGGGAQNGFYLRDVHSPFTFDTSILGTNKSLYFYQSHSNDTLFGRINVIGTNQTTPLTHAFDISYVDASDNTTQHGYYLRHTGTNDDFSLNLTIDISHNDVVEFTLLNDISFNDRIFIQELQSGSITGNVIVEDSRVLGVAGSIMNPITINIVDNSNIIFSSADNQVELFLASSGQTANVAPDISLSGTLVKDASYGIVVFNDLIINRPNVDFQIGLRSEQGEVLDFLTPLFNIEADLSFIADDNIVDYVLGIDVSNMGVHMIRGEFDTTTVIDLSLIEGTSFKNLDFDGTLVDSSYTTEFNADFSGNRSITISGGVCNVDISFNKITQGATMVFDGFNINQPETSRSFNVLGLIDICNGPIYEDTSRITLTAGEYFPTGNFINIVDGSQNKIQYNTFSQANVISLSGDDVITHLDHTTHFTDGSTNIDDISFTRIGSDYMVDLSFNGAFLNQRTLPIDVLGDLSSVKIPYKTSNRIAATDFTSLRFEVQDVHGTLINDAVIGVCAEILTSNELENASLTGNFSGDTSGGVIEFHNIDLQTDYTGSEISIYRIKLSGKDANSLVNSTISQPFTILYTAWSNNNVNLLAPGIPTIDAGDHLIQVDDEYYAVDNSYIIINSSVVDPVVGIDSNPHWIINPFTDVTTGNQQYARSMAWDTSGASAIAGAIYRIALKDGLSAGVYATADYSCNLINVDGTLGDLKYYDYSFNTDILSYTQQQTHVSNANVDTTRYNTSEPWVLTSIRSNGESMLLSRLLKERVPSFEHIAYFIGGNLSIFDNDDVRFKHVLYNWDIPGEQHNYFWIGRRSMFRYQP